MNFIDNHDKNSWEGTPYSNFGEALTAVTVFTFMMDGIPLVYNGQEAGLNRSLEFFEKDPIDWQTHDNTRLYSTIFALKHRNQALWNGRFGGEIVRIMNDKMDQVISFVREKNGDKVLVFINLSKDPVIAQFDTSFDKGSYQNLFSEAEQIVDETLIVDMAPWDYIVLHRTL
jgi:glycosidase